MSTMISRTTISPATLLTTIPDFSNALPTGAHSGIQAGPRAGMPARPLRGGHWTVCPASLSALVHMLGDVLRRSVPRRESARAGRQASTQCDPGRSCLIKSVPGRDRPEGNPITYGFCGHPINAGRQWPARLEAPRPSGGRARDHIFRRGTGAEPGPGPGHARGPGSRPRAGPGQCRVGPAVGSPARRVGHHRGPAAGPHLPAAPRPVPARPVSSRPPDRDTGRQLRRRRVREPIPVAAGGPRRHRSRAHRRGTRRPAHAARPPAARRSTAPHSTVPR